MGMAATPEKARHRWFQITPGRLLVVLLAVEGLLWLSERFHRLPKGWPAVIAIGAVGAFLLLMFLWFAAALLFRWRFQFSILSMLVLTVAVALPCAWLETEMQRARKQCEAASAIEELGGTVQRDFRSPWLRNLLGDDLLNGIFLVDFSHTHLTDSGLDQVKGLGELQGLWLGETQITDDGLVKLKALENNKLPELALIG